MIFLFDVQLRNKYDADDEVNHRTQLSVAGDQGQPATGTDQQGC